MLAIGIIHACDDIRSVLVDECDCSTCGDAKELRAMQGEFERRRACCQLRAICLCPANGRLEEASFEGLRYRFQLAVDF